MLLSDAVSARMIIAFEVNLQTQIICFEGKT